MKIKKKIGAKLNLTLDILGVENGFHTLKSLVAEISLCDTIVVKKRNDKKITLKIKGASLPTDETNNAFVAGREFVKTFNTNGADILIKKKIPIGGGLGGSSADIAGVLLALRELYSIDKSVDELAGKLGSDVNYMLSGGYAVMEGRGEKVRKIDSNMPLYVILLPCKDGVSTKECYKEFDEQEKLYPQTTELGERALKEESCENLLKALKNDLYLPAKTLLSKIEENLLALGKNNVSMTGSGSTTFALFSTKKERDKKYKQLKKTHNVIKAKTIIR